MNKLKELRLKSEGNLTLDDVSSATGIKRATLSRYENNNTEPKISALKKLADFYKVPVSELMGMDTVSDVLADMKKAGNIINTQADIYLSNQLNQIETSDLSAHDKLVLSKAIALAMNIRKDYSESDEQLVADFDSVIDFMFMLSSTKDATDDDDRIEENDWFEELKQENIKKFDKLATTLYNNQITEQNKKASDD